MVDADGRRLVRATVTVTYYTFVNKAERGLQLLISPQAVAEAIRQDDHMEVETTDITDDLDTRTDMPHGWQDIIPQDGLDERPLGVLAEYIRARREVDDQRKNLASLPKELLVTALRLVREFSIEDEDCTPTETLVNDRLSDLTYCDIPFSAFRSELLNEITHFILAVFEAHRSAPSTARYDGRLGVDNSDEWIEFYL